MRHPSRGFPDLQRLYAFLDIGLAELWSMTTVLNWPSRRVMERIGMSYRCSLEHPRVPVGNPVRPHVMYHLARSAVRPPADVAGTDGH